MNGKKSVGRSSVMAAERRIEIQHRLLAHGLVRVAALAKEFGVVENTVREDLDVLEREGMLVRVHGGAVLKEGAVPSRPYPETRESHMQEKALIGQAGLAYMPESGSVFIFGGSTNLQLATRLPRNPHLHVYTSSLQIASHIAANEIGPVEMVGGRVLSESMAVDMSLSKEEIDELYWDCAFLGASGIGIDFGVTTPIRSVAEMIRKVIQRTGRLVVLSDSSKIGRFAHALICPIEAIDVLVTDSGMDRQTIDALNAKGVEVAIATEGGTAQVFKPGNGMES